MSENETIINAENTQTEKKPWVTPTATAEQVNDVTKSNLGAGGDSVSCHS